MMNHANLELSCDVDKWQYQSAVETDLWCLKKGDNKIVDNNLTSWIIKSNIKMGILLYLIGHVVTSNRHILVLVFSNPIYRIKG